MYVNSLISFLIILSLLGVSAYLFNTVSAQVGQGINPVSDEGIVPGNIISRDSRTGFFYLSQTVDSPDVFGVIVERPLMTIIPDEESNVSVLRTGQARVNVVLKDGPIRTGDRIVTSDVPGYGMTAGSEHRNLVGIALEDLTESGATDIVFDIFDQEIPAGQLLVDLKIGATEGDEDIFPAEDEEDSVLEQIEHYLAMIARYMAAAMVALGAFYFAYYFFKANVKDGLSALGRNPLARQSIQKMMIFNMFLVILISVGGLLLSALILLIPVFIIRVM